METIVPYKEEFKKYIPEQYKNSEKLLALVNSCMAQFDDLETAFFEILQALNLADAIGPALDYLGAIVGVKRNPGESDTQYRERIVSGLNLLNLPGPEALRMVIKFLTGVDSVGLFPNWPAEMYYVLDGGTDANLSNLEKNSMTSGASLVRGTFLCAEEGEGGYIVNDDNGMPFVVDYLKIADIPDNVIRFTFSDQSYNPITAGVGPHGTWTKVAGSTKNEWDWTTEGITEGTGEFNGAFNDWTNNRVEISCRKFTNDIYGYKLFANNYALVKVELYGFDGLYGTMEQMFYYCQSVEEFVLKGNYTGLSSATEAFRGCYLAKNIQIDSLGGSTVANRTFAYCEELKSIVINDSSNVQEFNGTFSYCLKLESVFLDCSGATRLDGTLNNCRSLKNVTLKDTDNVTYMYGIFFNCESLEKAPELETCNVTTMQSMFSGCKSLKEVPHYNTHNVRVLNSTFEYCESLEYVPKFDTSNVETCYNIFNECKSLKEVPCFDTSNVTDFSEAFRNCKSLKEIPDIDTSKAKSVEVMFYGCINVERGAAELYNKLSLQITSSTFFVNCFKDCGINTISGIGDLTKIPTNWGGLGAIPANTLLFNFGDPNYNPNETTTSNHGTWTSYSTGYSDNTFNLWTWTYGGGEFGWANEFMPNKNSSYLSDFENNPVDVVAHGDLTDIKCYADLFLRASALRYCCDFVIPDASVNYPGYQGALQGMFSRCDNLEVFPHIDISNLICGISFISDICTKLTTIKPPTIRSIVGDYINARNAFKDCPNVERGAAETYAVLNNITTADTTDCFTNCGVNKLTGVSDLFKIPTSWGGLGLVSEKAVVFAFGDENYNPSTAGVGDGGTWTELSDNPTDFNIWTWTKSGNDWSGELENAFTDEGNKPYILAIGATGSVSNVDNFLKGSTFVLHGALDMYNQMSGQATPQSNHEKTFHDCGKLTEQGLFELLQIPVNWGGDVLTFCIENNLVAYLPDENQTEVLVQSIRYYQDVFRMMKNSDL